MATPYDSLYFVSSSLDASGGGDAKEGCSGDSVYSAYATLPAETKQMSSSATALVRGADDIAYSYPSDLGHEMAALDDTFASVTEHTRWNAQFQQALDLPEATVEQALAKFRRLGQLSEDFACTASELGKILISEYWLSEQSKTIKSARLGGTAGGEK